MRLLSSSATRYAPHPWLGRGHGDTDPGASVDNWLTEDGGAWLTEDGSLWLMD